METLASRFQPLPVQDVRTPLSFFERGRGNGPAVHAIQKTMQGTRPLCDPNMMVTWLGGRFDPTASDVCESCARSFDA